LIGPIRFGGDLELATQQTSKRAPTEETEVTCAESRLLKSEPTDIRSSQLTIN